MAADVGACAKATVRNIVLVVAFSLMASGNAKSASVEGDPLAGRSFAMRVCAQCHDVESRRDTPLSKLAPPDFHAIANAKTTSAIGLNVFLMTPHSKMPNLILSSTERRDVIAYILSLRDAKSSPIVTPAGYR